MAVRLGRHETYGPLVCGTCSEATRDQHRCPLALSGKDARGEERRPPRAPHAVPKIAIPMGTRRTEHFTACPVGVVLTDEVSAMLVTYGMVTRFQKWPPGRDDPRLLEALTVIQGEHDALDLERAKK